MPRLTLEDIARPPKLAPGSGEKAYQIIIGVLMAVALGVGGYATKRLDEISELKTQISLLTYQVEQMGKDSAVDAKQDETISKFWVLHSWAKDELTQLRAEHGLGLARWPNVTGGSN